MRRADARQEAAQRDRLSAHVRGHGRDLTPVGLLRPPADRVPDLVVLTGDVHSSWALDLHEDPLGRTGPALRPATGTGALGLEFVTPGIRSASVEPFGEQGVAACGAEARHPSTTRT